MYLKVKEKMLPSTPLAVVFFYLCCCYIFVCVENRSYNNGLIFYDLGTLTPYLPPTVSVSRGRTLANVKFSEKGSIWSTFGKPCECKANICGCCAGIKVKQYNFDQKMCANVTFMPTKDEAQLEVFLNEKPSSRYGISARNPSPFCIPVMMGIPMAMCVQLSNIAVQGNNLNMCMDFVVRLATTDLFEMHFQCMRMGLDGVMYLDKNGQPVIPPSVGSTSSKAKDEAESAGHGTTSTAESNDDYYYYEDTAPGNDGQNEIGNEESEISATGDSETVKPQLSEEVAPQTIEQQMLLLVQQQQKLVQQQQMLQQHKQQQFELQRLQAEQAQLELVQQQQQVTESEMSTTVGATAIIHEAPLESSDNDNNNNGDNESQNEIIEATTMPSAADTLLPPATAAAATTTVATETLHQSSQPDEDQITTPTTQIVEAENGANTAEDEMPTEAETEAEDVLVATTEAKAEAAADKTTAAVTTAEQEGTTEAVAVDNDNSNESFVAATTENGESAIYENISNDNGDNSDNDSYVAADSAAEQEEYENSAASADSAAHSAADEANSAPETNNDVRLTDASANQNNGDTPSVMEIMVADKLPQMNNQSVMAATEDKSAGKANAAASAAAAQRPTHVTSNTASAMNTPHTTAPTTTTTANNNSNKSGTTSMRRAKLARARLMARYWH